MFAPTATLAPTTLRTSSATAAVHARGCELRIPFDGSLSASTLSGTTSTLRRLIIGLRYGARLKGVTVTADAQQLTVAAVASPFAVRQWLDSGELVAAVEAAVRQAQRR